MKTEVVVLNGGSSSGKSTIARSLQRLLTEPWLTLGVDDLLDALGHEEDESSPVITFSPNGVVSVGEEFKRVEDAWFQGLATIARCGIGIIVDDVFLGGAASQIRLSSALSDLEILWVGVHCDADVAASREVSRLDRIEGMARTQAKIVHEGVNYDIEIDTSDMSPIECSRIISQRMNH